MKHLLARRWVKAGAGILLLALFALLATTWHFRVWSWGDFQIYQSMSRECHPVWKDLHWGRIYPGQDIEEVIASTKPVRVGRYGQFVCLDYQEGGLCFTGVTIMGKNGRAASASAWSCTWNRSFFAELTQDDWRAYGDAYEEHWRLIRGRREAAEKIENRQ
jgi:hypothetical protein